MTLQAFLAEGQSRLEHIYEAREVRALVMGLTAHATGIPPGELMLHFEAEMPPEALSFAERGIERLLAGEPLQYILEHVHFYGLEFRVTPEVLIPRPETEELVAWVLESCPVSDQDLHVLDVGTGSGCIAITLAWKRNAWSVYALDKYPAALEVAQRNAVKYRVAVAFFQSDILAEQVELPQLDVMVSNPPYIPQSEKAGLSRNVRDYEPPHALYVPDEDPLIFYRRIAQLGQEMLRPRGWLFFEVHADLGHQVQALVESLGYQQVVLKKDISGRIRMLRAQAAG